MSGGIRGPGAIWPAGGGTMGTLIRTHDWAATSLGPIESWPQSLRTIVDLMLATSQPVYITWGPEHTSLYNDGFLAILGPEHPRSLAKSYTEVWAEIRKEFLPLLQATMAGQPQHVVDRSIALAGRSSDLPPAERTPG